ncbi:MAG: phosphatase PAP2 family protein [bacterium]
MNNQIFFFFYNAAHKSIFIDNLIIFFAQYFPYLIIFLSVVFLLFHHEVFAKKFPIKALVIKFKEIILVFLSVILAWLSAIFLKNVFAIPRPFVQFSDVHSLVSETDFSFPSGHATFFMALAVAIFLHHKKVGYLFLVFALIIGIARIVAGVHFPVDILGGYIIGSIISYLLLKLFKKS